MDISLFDYTLPKSAIAQTPATPRDHAKLMVVDRKSQNISHYHFSDLPKILTPNDVLILNQTKVFPARIFGTKLTGGKIELLLLENISDNTWKAIYRGKISFGQTLVFGKIRGEVIRIDQNLLEIKFLCDKDDLFSYLERSGHTPLPPYIKSDSPENSLRKQYQTVFATEVGSVAAPTAGFHLTKELLTQLKKIGVGIEFVTLHVGLGTFAPIKVRDLTKHQIHEEIYELDKRTADRLNRAKAAGKRIIAVGTTTTRVLETCADAKGALTARKGRTKIFIYPPYKFKFLDALITNFHLPKSTLLSLVSALFSYPNTTAEFTSFAKSFLGDVYQSAIENKYRFYSFGDGMLII